jgi:hypothetical protein
MKNKEIKVFEIAMEAMDAHTTFESIIALFHFHFIYLFIYLLEYTKL